MRPLDSFASSFWASSDFSPAVDTAQTIRRRYPRLPPAQLDCDIAAKLRCWGDLTCVRHSLFLTSMRHRPRCPVLPCRSLPIFVRYPTYDTLEPIPESALVHASTSTFDEQPGERIVFAFPTSPRFGAGTSRCADRGWRNQRRCERRGASASRGAESRWSIGAISLDYVHAVLQPGVGRFQKYAENYELPLVRHLCMSHQPPHQAYPAISRRSGFLPRSTSTPPTSLGSPVSARPRTGRSTTSSPNRRRSTRRRSSTKQNPPSTWTACKAGSSTPTHMS